LKRPNRVRVRIKEDGRTWSIILKPLLRSPVFAQQDLTYFLSNGEIVSKRRKEIVLTNRPTRTTFALGDFSIKIDQ
jgi:hypothetical protein